MPELCTSNRGRAQLQPMPSPSGSRLSGSEPVDRDLGDPERQEIGAVDRRRVRRHACARVVRIAPLHRGSAIRRGRLPSAPERVRDAGAKEHDCDDQPEREQRDEQRVLDERPAVLTPDARSPTSRSPFPSLHDSPPSVERSPDEPVPRSGYDRTLALLAQSVEHLHGKEGVDGSSPSEGLRKGPQTWAFSFAPDDPDRHQLPLVNLWSTCG